MSARLKVAISWAVRLRTAGSVALFLLPFVAAFGMAYYHLHVA